MIRAFQWDLARQVERLDVLLAQLPRYAEWGYQELYLHLEDAVEYPRLPGIARADAYTHRELGQLVDTAARVGLRVVPIANLWGHTQYLIKHPRYRDLNELRAADGSPAEHGQICPLHIRMHDVADRIIADLAPFCTAGKIHVGLDESFHLGQCPRCRAEIAERGLSTHFAAYVWRLRERARVRGLRLGLWADMLAMIPEAIPMLPRDVIAYDWYYYPFHRHPRLELRNFAEYDLVPALRAQGIDYWGCPMSGPFRHEPMPLFDDRLANLRSWWQRCQRVQAAGYLVTCWEPQRVAWETTTVVAAAAASWWLDPAKDSPLAQLTEGCARVFGREHARATARAALQSDAHAFVGYARWEINDRWDACAGRESLASYARDARFFARLARRTPPLPVPFAASAAWLEYLCRRDVFVRRHARAVFRLRRRRRAGRAAEVQALLTTLQAEAAAFAIELRQARRAARLMWTRTRDPQPPGPNELLLAADARRLRRWRQWLRRAHAQPELVARATPLVGAWQLQVTVHHVAPALQKISIEQQQPDGRWLELHGRYTIEFQAAAARPRTRLKRELNAPVSSPDLPLRLALRGLGQLAVSHVVLTDGVQTRPAVGLTAPRRFGRPPPAEGWPALAFDAPAAVLPLTFA